ncbi:GNAT family N-acetyltransferase [Candidatus Babeliales bacterium]|nr:GNAT family N-acetyltransferase [Candidatus Babeliales bacterium]
MNVKNVLFSFFVVGVFCSQSNLSAAASSFVRAVAQQRRAVTPLYARMYTSSLHDDRIGFVDDYQSKDEQHVVALATKKELALPLFKTSNAVSKVYRVDGVPVAFVNYNRGSLDKLPWYPDFNAEVYHLAVHDDFGGRGIERELLQAAVQDCKKHAVKVVELRTHGWTTEELENLFVQEGFRLDSDEQSNVLWKKDVGVSFGYFMAPHGSNAFWGQFLVRCAVLGVVVLFVVYDEVVNGRASGHSRVDCADDDSGTVE